MKEKICPWCGGTGYYETGRPHSNEPNIACMECYGIGYIDEEVVEEDEDESTD